MKIYEKHGIIGWTPRIFLIKMRKNLFLTKYRICALNRICLRWVMNRDDWELREFSNFAKTRVRMLSFHMFHFTMLFTSGRMCCDNILMRVHTKLIWLSLTLNTSLENCTGVQTVFDRERVLSTISYSNCYRLYCTKRDVVSYRGQLHAMINYIGLFL